MKVAITGANGFLGSYLVKECLHQQMEVYALIRKGANTSLLPQNPRLHIQSLDYRDDLTDQFSAFKNQQGPVDFFIHNAGLTVSLRSEDYYEVNVGLTRAITEGLKKSGALKSAGTFVYTSSYAAHGPAVINAPVSHYGRSKLEAEKVIHSSMEKYLLVRPTAIYGAGDQAFLPLFKGAKMGVYPVTNGQQRMSMIHAADLAKMVAQDMKKETGTLHYNDGKTYFHRDFVAVFEEIFNKKITMFPLPKWLAKTSMGASDLWHRMIHKRPGITLEKFTEISQHWDLHTTPLKHSSVKPEISLKEGFEDALQFYQEKKLI